MPILLLFLLLSLLFLLFFYLAYLDERKHLDNWKDIVYFRPPMVSVTILIIVIRRNKTSIFLNQQNERNWSDSAFSNLEYCVTK